MISNVPETLFYMFFNLWRKRVCKQLWRNNRAIELPTHPTFHHAREQDAVRGGQLHDRVQSVQRRPPVHILEEVRFHERDERIRQLQDRQGVKKKARENL